jgi:hypothetical protein
MLGLEFPVITPSVFRPTVAVLTVPLSVNADLSTAYMPSTGNTTDLVFDA